MGGSDYETDAKACTSLLSVDVPGNIRNFLWRLAKHSIPTEDMRHNRNMSTVDNCQMCGVQNSWSHSFLEFSMAQCVWALVDDDLAGHLQATREPSA